MSGDTRAIALCAATKTLSLITQAYGPGSKERTEAGRLVAEMKKHGNGSDGTDLGEFFAAEAGLEEVAQKARATLEPSHYIQMIGDFLAEPEEVEHYLVNELVPANVVVLIHGEPRARKSLTGFELALAAATGTPPFGLERFTVPEAVPTLYVQEEDPRGPTRRRVRRLVRERCGDTPPAKLHIACRRGVNLDEPTWVEAILADCRRLGIKLLVFDAMRRLSGKTDEGPSKVREISHVLRRFVSELGVTVLIVHHDVKPSRDGQDTRRRSHRASGGDWFALCECPIHVEQVGRDETLVFPSDYKFSRDPAPFTFKVVFDGPLISKMVGRDTSVESAARAGKRGVLLEWLKANGPASKRAIQKGAAVRWETLGAVLADLEGENLIDSAPGVRNSTVYFVRSGEQSGAGAE